MIQWLILFVGLIVFINYMGRLDTVFHKYESEQPLGTKLGEIIHTNEKALLRDKSSIITKNE